MNQASSEHHDQTQLQRRDPRVGWMEATVTATTQSNLVTSIKLYTDAIHCILRYLEFRDFLLIIQLNHEFKEAVRSLKPRMNVAVHLHTSQCVTLEQYHTSALMPHVGAVRISRSPHISSLTQCKIISLFPSIHTTSLELMTNDKPSSPFVLPSTITNIYLDCTRCCLQQIVDCLGTLPLLRDLEIMYHGEWMDTEPNLNPLLQLKALEDVTLEFTIPSKSDTHVDARLIGFLHIFRQMEQLRSLDIGVANEKDLAELAKPFHQLQQLEGLCRLDQINNDSIQKLLAFPNLKKLFTYGWTADVSCLRQFSQLELLEFEIEADSMIPTVEDVVSTVSSLCHLQQLSFIHPELKGDDLVLLLAPLMKLHTLSLKHMYELQHLKAFEQDHVRRNITDLDLHDCPSLANSEAWTLRHLHSLRVLCIDESFQERFCDCTLQLFNPTSPFRIIPTLKSFGYRHPPDSKFMMWHHPTYEYANG